MRRRRRRKRLFDATLLAVVVLKLWHSYSSKMHPHKKKSS